MNIKKILSGMLIGGMAFSFVGCGGENAKIEFTPQVGSKYNCGIQDKTDFVVNREKIYSNDTNLSTDIDIKSKTDDGYLIGFNIDDFSSEVKLKNKLDKEKSIIRSDEKYRKFYDALDNLNIEYEVSDEGKVLAADVGQMDEYIKAAFGDEMLMSFLDTSMGTFSGITFSEGGLAVYRNILGDNYLLKDLVQVDILQNSDIKLSDIGTKLIIKDITDNFVLVKLEGNKKIVNTTYDLNISYLVDRSSGIVTKSECRLNIDHIQWQEAGTSERGDFSFVETSEWKEKE
ncbi:hypothetical protein KQI77_09540 [Clostridium sp. MSJ-8]|uniref:hypothetical protein n=1 Tax=Clostridium sp. MSJ-8 TaxID=2841510 RepID=UPI001C0F0332|nr:hypothetical protein [Clostridium sp. MSJ-8]MBU5488373.1 hypothetical protein [Clostridium sp. MSJ-8]